MGKGSKPRPFSISRKDFEDKYDQIDWGPRKETPSHGRTQVHKNKKKDWKPEA